MSDERLSLSGHQVNHRNLRRGEKPHRWTPGSRPPTDVEQGAVRQAIIPAMKGKNQTGDQTEWKNLPLVGVAGELEIEGPGGVLLYDRLVLEEDRKPTAPPGKDLPV
jgi:hypothetical protein